MDSNPIRYSDLVSPDSSITDLIEQLNELIATFENAKSKLVSDAAQMQKSIEGVSGATEEQRTQIQLVTVQTDKVLAEYQKLDSELLKAKTAQAQLNEANREASMIGKLIVQSNTAQEGSYNKLSAQYRLNKVTLNAMSQEQRYATEAGRQLEKETAAIYAKMNEMQKATGKYTLQVGNYERALGGMVGVNNNLISVLTDSKKAMETFRGMLGVLKSPIGAAIGAIGGLTAAFKLWKSSIHSTQDTGDEFDRRMAGWTNVWERFKVSVATVDFKGFVQDAVDAYSAGARLRDVLDEVFERTNSISLQRAALGMANEQLLEDFRNQNLTYKQRIKAGEDYLKQIKIIYTQEQEKLKDVRDEEANLLWDRVKRRAKQRGVTREQFFENIKMYASDMSLVRSAKAYNKQIDALTEAEHSYMVAARTADSQFDQLRWAEKAKEASDAREKIVKDTAADVKAFGDFLRVYGLTNDKIVKSYVDAEVAYLESVTAYSRENRRITTQLHSLEAQSAKESNERRQKQLSDAHKANITTLRDQIETTQAEIDAAAKGSDEKRELILKKIRLQRAVEIAENKEKAESERRSEKVINDKWDAEEIKALKELEDEKEKVRQDGIKQRVALLKLAQGNIRTQMEIELKDTEHYLELRLQAIEVERQIELQTNLAKAEELRQNEADINAKYDALALRTAAEFRTKMAQQALADEQELAKARFEQLDNNERQVTQFRIMQERQRIIRLLQIDKTAAVKMTEEQREALQETLKALEKEAQTLPYNNLYELLNLNVSGKQQSALNTAINSIKDSISGLANSWAEAAEAAVKAADDQVDAAKKALDAEIEARNAGYANNVAMAQRELQLAQSNREKALKEQQKAQRAQAIIDTLEQSSSLVTATANIWKAWGKNPIVAGVITATMWSAFLAAKIKAAQVTKYEHGGVELLEGGSHASGHDIDLGMTKSGRRRKAEGGEYLAIVNKQSSRKYGAIIPSVINALNDGTFESQFQRAGEVMSNTVVGYGTDVSTIEREVTRIRQQGDESRTFEGGAIIMRYKNLTRKIKS